MTSVTSKNLQHCVSDLEDSHSFMYPKSDDDTPLFAIPRIRTQHALDDLAEITQIECVV